MRVFLVISFRPEFEPPWTRLPHVTHWSLSRLDRDEGAAIVDRIAGGKSLPTEVTDQILAKTDGVPLFVEELTKTVIESGLLTDAGDQYVLSGSLYVCWRSVDVAGFVDGSSRPTRPAKKVAQIGACIGRVFHHDCSLL